MGEKETGRLEAFSDGVIAVAITLLILDVKPSVLDSNGALLSDGQLGRQLLQQWPVFSIFSGATLRITIGY
jgi:uncharacterized membrane protein